VNFERFNFAAIYVEGNGDDTVIRNCTFRNAGAEFLYLGKENLHLAAGIFFSDPETGSYAGDMVIENNYFDLFADDPHKQVFLSAALWWYYVWPEKAGRPRGKRWPT